MNETQKNPTPKPRLSTADVHRMLRVNHAGEYGAVRIYEGQQAILGHSTIADDLSHMVAQEKEHRQKFESLIVQNQVRPTLLSPLWHIAGFALGAGSALLGKKAAMACTVAVEEVIDEHYRSQLKTLECADLGLQNNGQGRGGTTPNVQEIKKIIQKCHEEELEHRDLGVAFGAPSMKGYRVFTAIVKRASKAAIWLSTRI